MAKGKRFFHPDEPLKHPDHRRPMSRREFIAQGFRAGTATVLGASVLNMLASRAHAISPDLLAKYINLSTCDLGNLSGFKIPFICFDLAGGANISGSNVLVGQQGGQLDLLSTAGYSKLGLPPDILPDSSTNNFIDTSLGLAFHTTSAMLRGIQERSSAMAQASTNGAVIPARSDNDTGNNPHNPMYGIYRAGARGQLLQLIGSQTSDSGGNSMAPAMLIDPEVRPTKVDRPSDASGLVDVGDLSRVLSTNDAVQVMESMKRITDMKLDLVNTVSDPGENTRLKERFSCEYLKSADTLEKFSDPAALDPTQDADIVGGAAPIFSAAEIGNGGDREFRKTASVMKLVIDGYAGAGTVSMGGYDYHTGDRRTGEARDLRAGRCIGACLEYAHRKGKPVMIYVFSDGSVFSNGMMETVDGVEKGVWTGDNSSTAASFFLVYNPAGRPQLMSQASQQIGWMRPDASVETAATPAANNVNLLVETVILNYMALHNEVGAFSSSNFFPGHGLGSNYENYVAFQPLFNQYINNPL